MIHELLHGAAVTKIANENVDVTDIYIEIEAAESTEGDDETQLEWVEAYGALKAKLLARTISDYNTEWVVYNGTL